MKGSSEVLPSLELQLVQRDEQCDSGASDFAADKPATVRALMPSPRPARTPPYLYYSQGYWRRNIYLNRPNFDKMVCTQGLLDLLGRRHTPHKSLKMPALHPVVHRKSTATISKSVYAPFLLPVQCGRASLLKTLCRIEKQALPPGQVQTNTILRSLRGFGHPCRNGSRNQPPQKYPA
jgi:hypothetical protein